MTIIPACDDYYSSSSYNSTSNHTTNSTVNSSGSHGGYALPALFVVLAFAAALTSSLISLFNIYKHLTNYTRPEYQKSLIRILFIVPVYAMLSWAALAVPPKALIFESIRDIWEAVVIYEFLKLVLAYCGGESSCLLVIMKSPGSISHMWPFNYCLPRMRLDARFMRTCKRFTLQFVFIKPIMAISNIIMFETCNYNNSTFQMAELIIYNLSYCFSLYGLLLFYFATHHHPGLKSRKPLLKFAGIKLIIFATYYQSLLVQLVPGFNENYLAALNNFIFCWEMIFFSLLHLWAFGWFEFVGGSAGIGDPDPSDSIEIGAGIGGVHSLAYREGDFDLDDGNGKSKSNDLQGNVKDAFNMEDVVTDALENFNTKYEQHVRLDTKNNNSSLLITENEEDEEAQSNPFQNQLANSSKVEPMLPSNTKRDSGLNSSTNGQHNQPYQQPQQQQSNPFKNPFDDDLSPI